MKKQIFKRRLRLAFAPICLTALFWWLISTSGAREALNIMAFALPVGGVLGLVGLSLRLKSAFSRFFAPGSLRIGSAEEFPHLDRAQWQQLTQLWQQLGFELRVDRAGNMENPAFGPTFSRTLEHRAQGAVAEISQMFLPNKIGPITLSLASFWGERAPVLQMAAQLQSADNAKAPLAAPGAPQAATAPGLPDEMELWLLITHNRAPNKFWPLVRQKRLLSRRMASDITPENLWRAHLEQRAQIEARLQLPHETDDMEKLLEAHALVLSAQLQARLKRTPAWKFGWVRLSRAHSPAVYDGELPA